MIHEINNMGKLIRLIAGFIFLGLIFIISSCENMEDTYKDYMIERVYSPKVKNLKAINGFKEVTLKWDNPQGEIAKKIEIRYEDQKLIYDELINEVVIKNLLLKGYNMSVYTIDAQGNYSIPVVVYVFPVVKENN